MNKKVIRRKSIKKGYLLQNVERGRGLFTNIKSILVLITSGSLTKGGFNKRMMHTKNKLKKEVNELKNELNIQRC